MSTAWRVYTSLAGFLLPFHTFTCHKSMFIVAIILEVTLLCWYKETRLAAQLLCHGKQDRWGTLDGSVKHGAAAAELKITLFYSVVFT